MKRIIAFIFLGIVVYCGIFLMIYGFNEYLSGLNDPITLDMTFQHNVPVTDSVSKQYGTAGTRTYQAKLLGIPVGKQTETHFYVIAVGDHPDFLLLGVSEPEDIEALENVSIDNKFTFTGVMKTMTETDHNRLRSFLVNNPKLIDAVNKPYTVEINADNHILDYTIFVSDIKERDITPIIVGAAVFLIGAGLAALLIVRIVRERTGY